MSFLLLLKCKRRVDVAAKVKDRVLLAEGRAINAEEAKGKGFLIKEI